LPLSRMISVSFFSSWLSWLPLWLQSSEEVSMSTTITFADLTHTGVTVEANNIPLAVGYIAAYAKMRLGPAIDARLFKYPAALSRFLLQQTPMMACFTNYMWNERLSCTYAREIKRHHPKTITVMG